MGKPLVSIIIRTCGRPSVLKRALVSVREQKYSNIEVIVVEDGGNISERFITEEFSDMNIHYTYTGIHQGRCKTGNLGLSLANGKYLNFLDDDDLLLPNHVAKLVGQLENTSYRAVYAIAQEQQIQVSVSEKNFFHVKRKLIRYKQPFNRLLLCYMNYIPIQSIMFERELYEELGGFDEQLDVLEDWDLWLRYALLNDFLFLPQVTSIYYTPYKSRKKQTRALEMKKAESTVLHKHQAYFVTMNAAQIHKEMEYILNVFNKKGFLFYMQKIRNFLLYYDF